MSLDHAIAEHYRNGNLLAAIESALAILGIMPEDVTVSTLAPVDEFHIGGREATAHLFAQLDFSEEDHLLDVGCGVGGASRFVADKFNGRVTGIDLTPEYVETGNILSKWVGLDEQVLLQQGSVLAMSFADATFDGGFMFHVGMNIEDKARLFGEIHRVLRPGAIFGMYDIMQIGDGTLTYPVPWASVPETSYLETPQVYRQALMEAGFTLVAEKNRHAFAVKFFNEVQVRNKANDGPSPLGLHTLIGVSTAVKFQNMIQNIKSGHIAPVEIIAQK